MSSRVPARSNAARVRAVLAAAGIAAGAVITASAVAAPAALASSPPATHSVSTHAAPVPPAHRPVLRLGSHGYAVRWVQWRVGAHQNGYYGAATRAAVEKFQRAHRLPADGLVGARTWRALTAVRHARAHRAAHTAVHGGVSTAFVKKADRVLQVASWQRGKPYRFGAAGRYAFDCSGLVRFVMWHALHESLPRSAAAQYAASRHISYKQLRPGDLIFVDAGGYIDHVGIYAGHDRWWVARHTGTRVQLQKLYHAHFVYGRVIH
jgi:cell wall-associated NlpC family hydrolase